MSAHKPPAAPDGAPSPEWLEVANYHATVAHLLSTVVHQVNNALQTIGGHAELLRTEPGVGITVARRAEAIANVTSRIAQLLADVQSLARPREEPGIVDLRVVAERALALRQYGLGRAKIDASVVGEGVTLVTAETHALFQVVLNLILNAEQALSGGSGGRVTLAVNRVVDDVVMQVDDTGPGLGVDTEGEGSARGPRARLGLGLSVAHSIVSRLGGTLSVDAGPMAGARVTVRLRAAPG